MKNTFLKSVLIVSFLVSGCTTTGSGLNTIDVQHGEIKEPGRISLEYRLYQTQSKSAPTVIIAHGCIGPKPKSLDVWAQQYREFGYNVLIVDSFSGRGYSNICPNDTVRLVTPEMRANDIRRAAAFIKTQSWHRGKIAVVGYSHGGSTTLNLSNNPAAIKDIDAVISYYPSCHRGFVNRDYSQPIIPSMVHAAENDDWTPVSQCTNMEKHIFYVYPDATQGFITLTNFNDLGKYSIIRDNSATELALSRDIKFLRDTIGN